MHFAFCIQNKGKEREPLSPYFYMDKNSLINRYAENDGEKIKLAHIVDLAERCEKRNIVTSTAFLTESERAKAEMLLRGLGFSNFVFFGGFDGAERTSAVFLPDYIDEVSLGVSGITFCEVMVDKFNMSSVDFSHRDILGSLMGLGIERELIGDITADGGRGVFVLRESVAPFILENLKKIGRFPISVRISDDIKFEVKEDFELKSDTVSSLRLDSVVASAFSLSRAASSEAVSSGIVTINGTTIKKCDAEVKEGAKISLKGKGKILLVNTDGFSRKGRIRIIFKRFR